MANSLIDVIKEIFSSNQTNFNVLSKQFETMSLQLQQPDFIRRLAQQQQGQSLPQLSKKTEQAKQSVSSNVKKIQPTKKPLTIKTLETKIEPQSAIPILPYTPEGIVELVKQGKLSAAQTQQMLQTIATEELSIEKWLAEIKQNIIGLPDEIKAEMNKEEGKMNNAYDALEKNLKEQVKVHQKYADEQLFVLRKHLNWIQKVFTDLMREKPNLEPDKWTQFGRQLAMSLGAISALAHPGYAPYFYMAIPQVVQYWHNEDMQNFEKAMRKFELALQTAGTQLDFYNQIMEHNLTILEKLKEKELLPKTIAGQLLAEKYHAHVDAYNKLKTEYARALSDKISHQLSAIKAGIMLQHYKDWKEIQQFAKQIELERLKEMQRHNRVMEGIRNLMTKIMGEKFEFEKLKQFYPWLFPEKLLKSLNIKDNPQLVYDILLAYALYGPQKALTVIPQILYKYSEETSSDKKKGKEKEKSEDIIFLGEGAEDFPKWFYGE
jgi:hypothetical protein